MRIIGSPYCHSVRRECTTITVRNCFSGKYRWVWMRLVSHFREGQSVLFFFFRHHFQIGSATLTYWVPGAYRQLRSSLFWDVT